MVLTPFPYIFYIYGSKIRGWSKFAPAFDLKVRKELEEEGKLPKDSLNTTGPFDRNGLKQAKQERAAKKDPEKQQQQSRSLLRINCLCVCRAVAYEAHHFIPPALHCSVSSHHRSSIATNITLYHRQTPFIN